LRDLGISCGVLVAPVLPGLSDSEEQLTEVVEACAEAGAVSIAAVALHLRGAVRAHYFDWLAAARPDLVRLHRGRFHRGAYQEDAARERVEGIVRAAARRCGVTGRDRYRGRSRAAAPAEDGGRERDSRQDDDLEGSGGRGRPEGEQLQLL
jgi:DNA repair photolyase